MKRQEFECDVCGRRCKGKARPCHLCRLSVCEACDYGQAGRGHLEAEHANERRSR
jgi:hypothetical protein